MAKYTNILPICMKIYRMQWRGKKQITRQQGCSNIKFSGQPNFNIASISGVAEATENWVGKASNYIINPSP